MMQKVWNVNINQKATEATLDPAVLSMERDAPWDLNMMYFEWGSVIY